MEEKAQPSRAAPPQPSEDELRELMMRGEAARQQLAQLETQREYVLELLADARRSSATVEHLENAKDGDEILIPVGAGTFVSGKLAHGGKAITSVGSGIHAEMTATQARERLETRVKDLEEAATALARDIGRVTDELARLNAAAEAAYGG